MTGSMVTAQRKYGQPFEFSNYARFLFSANKFPTSSDKSFAFYRRLVFIPFTRTFTGADADKYLTEKLRGEMPGIMNRALSGMRRLYDQDDFTIPGVVAQALEEYKIANDTVAAFISERVVEDPDGFITKQDFYDTYKSWCEVEQGIKRTATQSVIKSSLTIAIPSVFEHREGKSGPRGWKGIKWSE